MPAHYFLFLFFLSFHTCNLLIVFCPYDTENGKTLTLVVINFVIFAPANKQKSIEQTDSYIYPLDIARPFYLLLWRDYLVYARTRGEWRNDCPCPSV